MAETVTLPIPGLQAIPFAQFLRRELAPNLGRWRATLRVTLACVAASWPVMAFQLHEGLIVMILMFLISKEDTTTTLLGTVLGIIGITIGCAALLLTYELFADLTWLRVLLVPTFIALGLFLNRILTAGPLGSAISVPLALGMIVPDVTTSTEALTRFPFYVWWAAILGLSVNLFVQYLLNPERAQSVLIRSLTTRLRAVETALLGLAGEPGIPPSGSLKELAIEGAAEQLHLLKLASAAEPFLKQHHTTVGAQIILVDRLVTAAAALQDQKPLLLSESTVSRLRHIAGAVAMWRAAVAESRWPQIEEPVGAPARVPGPPMLAEMERVLRVVATVKATNSLPGELKGFPMALKGGAVVADAWTNPAYVHFAVKGAMAGFICYLIFTLSAYQGIYTSVVTCLVCSLSTIGASVQKGIFRFAGSAVGGVLGVFTLMYIFPNLDSIGGFWIPFAAVTALAAYVTFSGPTLSYCGYQIGLAFYKCTMQSYGPYTELRVVRDRLIGILLGLAVFGIIDNRLWPVKALDTARAKLASALRTLARLARLPDEGGDPTPRLVEAYDLRLQAYQSLHAGHNLLESAKFESGKESRERLELINHTTETLLLQLLAIVQHRSDVRPTDSPEPLRQASVDFRTALAEALLDFANRLEGRPGETTITLNSALAELEGTFAVEIRSVSDGNIAAQMESRVELYQQTVPTAMNLFRLVTA